MTMFNNSLFNKQIFREDFMRQHTIYVFYCLLVIGPPFFLLDIELPFKIGHIENAAEVFHFGALTLMPTLLAFRQFGYLTKSNWLSYIHSLPVTRRQLLFSKLISGFIMLVSPLLFFYVLGKMNTPINQSFFSGDYFFSSTLLVILIYLFSIFAIISFKNVWKGFSFLIFFNIIPLLTVELLRINQITYWNGFYVLDNKANVGINNVLAYRFFNSTLKQSHHYSYYLFFVFLIVVLIGIVFLSYCRQKDEHFEPPKYLNYLVEFGIVFMFTLTGALYFSHMKWHPGWGYLIGAIIGEAIIAVIMNQKMGFKQIRWGGVIVLAMMCQLIFITDITGFENRIPESSQVAEVVFDNKISYDPQLTYESQEMINKIINFHHKVLTKPTYGNGYDQVVFDYTLKNHRHIKRRYSIDRNMFEKEYRAMIESSEYKEKVYAAFYQDPNQIGAIKISSYIFDNEFDLSNRDMINQLMAVLHKDVQKASADDLVYKAYQMGEFSFYDQEGNLISSEPILSHFDETKAWLNNQEVLSQISVIASNIDHIRLEYKGTDILKPDQVIVDNEHYFDGLLDHITSGSYTMSEDYYTVGIYLKSDLEFVVLAYIDSDDLSDAFRKHYFK